MADDSLSFQVVQCTSEDPTHPAVSLNQSGSTVSSHKGGWQSQNYAPFPQELTLALAEPAFITSMRILCHEYYIPSKVEIYLGKLPPNAPPHSSWRSASFIRLGHFSFSDNRQSGYKARELKTVKVQTEAQFIRFVLMKCHVNEYNQLNKVSLLKVLIFGSKTAFNSSPDQLSPQLSSPIETMIDQTTAQQLKVLIEHKDKAVRDEDYRKAEQFKILIERFRKAGEEIRKLEIQKENAVVVENFALCQELKDKIQAIRTAALEGSQFSVKSEQPVRLPPQPPSCTPVKPPSVSPVAPVVSPVIVHESPMVLPPKTPVVPHDETPIRPPTITPPKPIVDPLEVPIKTNYTVNQNVDDRPIKPAVINRDDIVVGPSRKLDFQEQEEAFPEANQSEDNGPVPKLTAKNRDLAGDVIRLAGDDTAAKLFSKKWQHRLEAAKFLAELASRHAGPSRGYYHALEILSSDSHANVFASTVAGKPDLAPSTVNCGVLLSAVLKNGAKFSPHLTPSDLVTVVKTLIGRLSESNVRITKPAAFALKCISSYRHDYAEMTLNSALECFNSVTDKARGAKNQLPFAKPLCGSLSAIIDACNALISLKNTLPPSLSLPLSDVVVPSLVHTSTDVRALAVDLFKVYSTVYSKQAALKLLKSDNETPDVVKYLRNAAMALEEGNEEASVEPVITTKPVQHSPVKNVEKKLVPVQQSKKSSPVKETPAPTQSQPPAPSRSGMHADDTMDGFTCEYCGFSFPSQDELDLHWYQLCPYLTLCPSCEAIMLIELLNEHLLTQCQNSSSFKQCKKCREAVASNKMNDHVKWNKCKPPSGSDFIRCSLCHGDVAADTWHDHVESRCKKNPRVGPFQQVLSEVSPVS
ncbi:hypothetical protein RCL1_003939 [Eukaryota sp. TZLM3-RCL]